ncbi:MAG: hypothetical protein JSS66_01635 [Armatimonadetes bacterium]|nr:hypothetical protein [Armatimonadota bacterium]
MKFLALMALALSATATFAQEGASSATSIGFGETTKVNVSDYLSRWLTVFGEEPGDQWTSLKKQAGPIEGTTEFTFPNFRVVLFDAGGSVYLVDNMRMVRQGGASWQKQPKYGSIEDFQKAFEDFAAKQNWRMLSSDAQQLSGMELTSAETVSAEQARKNNVNGGRPYFELYYKLRSYGYEYRESPDYIYVAADAKMGDLLFYRHRLEQHGTQGFRGKHLELDQVLETAKAAHAGEVTETPGEFWVKPNRLFSAPKLEDGPISFHLAHVVVFGKDEVWVDSYSGQLLGGIQGK